LWFAGNAIIDAIQKESATAHADVTSVVQFGFIAGTLLFSILTIADRFNPARVFFFSSLIASIANLFIIWLANDIFIFPALRFVTGFFLAGIYPVGMKIAADLFPKKLGKALGFLVGALVLGTAFPHLIRSLLQSVDWKIVVLCTSVLALAGGLLILLMIPTKNTNTSFRKMQWRTSLHVFKSKDFRSAAFGYFGHMWELYAFWAIIPVLLIYYNVLNSKEINVAFWSFIIIAIGALGCIGGGIVSQKTGSKKVAFYSLLISGLCCLTSPFLFESSPPIFLSFLMIWGFTVIADSPQFSALVAKSAEENNKGTALTIVTCIGFAITIISIQVLKSLFLKYGEYGLLILAIGPFLGLLFLKSTGSLSNNKSQL